MEASFSQPIWSTRRKIFFRYIFIFFSVIVLPFPLDLIPGLDFLTSYYNQFWTSAINFAAKTIFHIEETLTLKATGSGDRLYDWLWYFCLIMVTILIGSVFSILDRSRSNYNRLNGWFILILSYYLAYILLVYGIIKLFYLQFGPPNLERLFQTFGQASPMRLLWTFMGFSETYTIFSGLCETIAGILLLIGRTRTLGALLSIGVMLNVFMLNMSYDVPVKLFSFQLLLIGTYLASLDGRRLMSFFVLNQPTPARPTQPLSHTRRGKYILFGIKLLFITYVIYSQVDGALRAQKQYGSKREKSVMYGVYNVATFIRNNDTVPPLTSDVKRWQRVLFDYPTFASVMMMNDSVTRYTSKIDTINQTMSFSPQGDTINEYLFTYTEDGANLQMDGILEKDTLRVNMRHYDLTNFGLLNRGFHWINEVPYNRYNYD